ncbi:hypothetical protein [Paraburkholderia nodosa]|uniref:hypothetical protein n=1 Tax=Paraburkholderia nodosa TaxID=392320 RepID=UPI000841C6CC|nr:hypothetical protein [Paraburkholderia nodosa]
MNRSIPAAVVVCLFCPMIANAQSCDFDKPVGTCTASYRVQSIRNDPAKINSAAEIKLTVPGAQCSKVTFYVDSTPYISVFDHKTTVIEQIFGTTTITDQTVSIDSCQTYAMKDDRKKDGDGSKDPNAADGDVAKMFNDAAINPAFDPTESGASFDQLADGAASSDEGFGMILSVLGGTTQAISANQAATGARAAAAAMIATPTVTGNAAMKPSDNNPRPINCTYGPTTDARYACAH